MSRPLQVVAVIGAIALFAAATWVAWTVPVIEIGGL
jgi:hypothetical protein